MWEELGTTASLLASFISKERGGAGSSEVREGRNAPATDGHASGDSDDDSDAGSVRSSDAGSEGYP